MTTVELRNLAAKLRTIYANPQDNIFIYRAADELEKLTQQVAGPMTKLDRLNAARSRAVTDSVGMWEAFEWGLTDAEAHHKITPQGDKQ